jgi:hypothetical protein
MQDLTILTKCDNVVGVSQTTNCNVSDSVRSVLCRHYKRQTGDLRVLVIQTTVVAVLRNKPSSPKMLW